MMRRTNFETTLKRTAGIKILSGVLFCLNRAILAVVGIPRCVPAWILVFVCSNLTLITAQNTVDRLDEAIEIAQRDHKSIMMVFSGSDWCKPCIRLKTEVLDSDDFQKYYVPRLIILEVDFPYRTKQDDQQRTHNEQLADMYNRHGEFPKVLLFDESMKRGEELNSSDYQSSESLIAKINKYQQSE